MIFKKKKEEEAPSSVQDYRCAPSCLDLKTLPFDYGV